MVITALLTMNNVSGPRVGTDEAIIDLVYSVTFTTQG